jgi:hypothetical protein
MYEVIAAPYTCFVAPVGTTFPPLEASEGAFPPAWTKLGTSGTKNYSEAGVTVTHTQTVAEFVSAGGAHARKAWRTDEGLDIAFELADLSLSQYALILDSVPVIEGAGEQSITLERGIKVHGYAMLLRGPSPIAANGVSQYEIAACYQSANPAPKFALKGGPAMLAVQFTAVETQPGEFARLRVGEEEEIPPFPEDELYPEDALIP